MCIQLRVTKRVVVNFSLCVLTQEFYSLTVWSHHSTSQMAPSLPLHHCSRATSETSYTNSIRNNKETEQKCLAYRNHKN